MFDGTSRRAARGRRRAAGAASDDPALAGADRAGRAPRRPDAAIRSSTLLTDHLGELLDDGFAPVVFCRYIATAALPRARSSTATLQRRDGRGRHRRAHRRGARETGRGAGRGRAAPAGRDRLPVRGHQPPGALRRGRPLRPLVEPDPPRAARGPGRPLRPEARGRPRDAALRRQQPGRRRRARGDPAQGARRSARSWACPCRCPTRATR